MALISFVMLFFSSSLTYLYIVGTGEIIQTKFQGFSIFFAESLAEDLSRETKVCGEDKNHGKRMSGEHVQFFNLTLVLIVGFVP